MGDTPKKDNITGEASLITPSNRLKYRTSPTRKRIIARTRKEEKEKKTTDPDSKDLDALAADTCFCF